MVGAPLLPFPAAGGVNAPLRSGSTTGAAAPGKFADAMDGALDAQRSSRRADSPARSSRRAETSRTRDAADRAAALSRKADAAKAPAAKKSERTDETAVDDSPREAAADESSECAPADQPQAPREEA